MIFLVFSKLSELCGVMKYHILRYSAFEDGYSGLADNPEGVAWCINPSFPRACERSEHVRRSWGKVKHTLSRYPEGVVYPSKPYKELSNIEMQPSLGFSPALVFSLES